MKLPPLVLASVLAGCARSSVAALIPQVDLTARLARAHAGVRDAERMHLVLGAWLRWEPLVLEPGAGSAVTLAEAITPCEGGDASCLSEHIEAEAEIARLRLGAP